MQIEVKKFNQLEYEVLQKIIHKHFSHWSQFSPLMSLEATQDKFINLYAKNDTIPFGIAMFDKDELIGFCVLKMDCLKKYPQFYPWISDVMIFNQFRNQGYGRKLIEEALTIVSSLGYKSAYLWTDQAPEFYKKIGFNYLQPVEKNEGGFGQLFCKEIKSDQQKEDVL